MPNEVVGKCPVCKEPLLVSELQCPTCNIKISGQFELCKFCKLDPEQRAFAEVFIKNRGNIREVEKELGISYPTVRGRLENLIRALGYSVSPEPGDVTDEASVAKEKKSIIDKLGRGELSPTEAARLLRNLTSR
jgi:hypothetical protein